MNLRDQNSLTGWKRRIVIVATIIVAAAVTTGAMPEPEESVVIHLIIHYCWNDHVERPADDPVGDPILVRAGQSFSSYRFLVGEGETFGLGDSAMGPFPGRPFRLTRIVNRDTVKLAVMDPMMSMMNRPSWDSAKEAVISYSDVRLATYLPVNGVGYYLRLDSADVPVRDEDPDDGLIGGRVASGVSQDTPIVQFFQERRDPWGCAKEWGETPDSTGHLLPHGVFASYYEDGSILERSEFEFGVRVGRYSRHFKTGQAEIEGFFRRGVPEGEFRFWNEDGSIAGTAVFVDGDAVVNLCYGNGAPRRQVRYSRGVPCGQYREWRSDGCQMRQIDLPDTVTDTLQVVATDITWRQVEPVSGFKWLPVGLGPDYPYHEYNPPKSQRLISCGSRDSVGICFDSLAIDSQFQWNALLESHGCAGSWSLEAMSGYIDTVGYPQFATGRRGHWVMRTRSGVGTATVETHCLNRCGDSYSLVYDSSGHLVSVNETRVTSGSAVKYLCYPAANLIGMNYENFDSRGVHRTADALYFFDRCTAQVTFRESITPAILTRVHWDQGGGIRIEHWEGRSIIRCDTIAAPVPH